MKYLILLSAFVLGLTAVNAGVIPYGSTTTTIQGPSTRSRIMGPDGSVITAQAPGGQIVHEETPGVLRPAGHFLGPASPLVSPVVPGVAATKAVGTIAGAPSETIATGKHIAQTAEDGTHSIMGGVGASNGFMDTGVGSL